MDILDKRYNEKIKKEGILVARKNRLNGSMSTIKPRQDVPEWAVDPEWTEGW
jgi:hypothetical protein